MAAWPIRCSKAVFDGSRTYVMGVLNLTPDSFSDGGRYVEPERAVARARELVGQGADLIDVGAESTRPGAEPVEAATEWARLRPVLEALRELPVPISVDTYKAEVAERALGLGVDIINDVSGGRLDARMHGVCAARRAVLIVQHLRGEPRHMQEQVAFDDVYAEVERELGEALAAARAAGVEQLIADPGIGFGKRLEHDLVLLARCGELGASLGAPVLVGPSRKRFLGELTGLPVGERGAATLGAVAAAAERGAGFVRVHDVAAARQALRVAEAIRGATKHTTATRGART